MRLADYLVDFLANLGIKHIFMVPGGGAMHLNDALGSCRKLEFVCNLHEQASAIAAENYAKVTGLGAAVVTTGPGGTNAVTGVAGAWLDSTPVLFVSGQVKRSDLRHGHGVRQLGLQEVDIVAIVGSITKYAVTVTEPARIRYHLEKAAFLARTGRPGPVWIDIPLDVQAATIDPETLPGFDPGEIAVAADPRRLTESAVQAIRWLNQAERPVLLAGNGIRLAGATAAFLELAELLGVPVLTTWLAIDLIPETHPLFMGRPGGVAPRGPNFTLQNADWLLAVGARLDLALTGYNPENLARGARKVVVDVDPAELAKPGHRIDLPIAADAGDLLREIWQHRGAIERRDRSAWLERCRRWKAHYPVVLPEHRTASSRVSMYYLSEVFGEVLAGTDVIVSGSSGAAIEVFLLAYRVRTGQRILHTTALGAMGFGVPAAIGASLASGRRTICVDGDGGFLFNIQELETVARLRLPIKFFVINNEGYSSIRTSQATWFAGRLVGADATSGLTLPDLRAVASAFKIDTERIEDQRDLAQRVRAVLDRPGPVVCEVLAIPDEVRAPRIASAQRADGSMVSRPLEDLWPFLGREEFRANMIVPPLPD